VIKDRRLYEAPAGTEPPPFWIRGLLILTCTGVSFSHGSNDGQKGMGLIMLILVGTVPTAYALNHAVTRSETADFLASSQQTVQVVGKYVQPSAIIGDARDNLTNYIRTKEFDKNTMLALRQYVNDVGNEVSGFQMLKNVPTDRMGNLRNEMYVISEAIRLIEKSGKTEFTADDKKVLANYKKHLDLRPSSSPRG
jgi:PiT family inorganic phosphate transporter